MLIADFTADAVFPDDSIKLLTLSSYRGQYVVLFFYPLDFTFVCPSEILAFNQRVDAFKSRNVQVKTCKTYLKLCVLKRKAVESKLPTTLNVSQPRLNSTFSIAAYWSFR